MDSPENVDAVLERIEELYRRGDIAGAATEIERARGRFPEDLSLKEWEATLAGDEGRYLDALEIIDEVLAAEGGRASAARERASLLIDLGRFAEALEALEALETAGAGEDDPSELGSIHYERALCLDREGRTEEADREFREAGRLAPREYPAPGRMSAREFDAIVADAIDSLPGRFRPYLDQVSVAVRDYPFTQDIDPFALGLYAGLPRTERSADTRDHLDNIFIFKRNHELQCLGPEALREEVRKTVVHEIAHHFGLGEEDMGDYA